MHTYANVPRSRNSSVHKNVSICFDAVLGTDLIKSSLLPLSRFLASMVDAQVPPLKLTRSAFTPHLLLVFFQLFFLSAPPFSGRKQIAIGTLLVPAVWAQLSPWTHNSGPANFAALAWPHWLATIEKFLNYAPNPEAYLWPIDTNAGVAHIFGLRMAQAEMGDVSDPQCTRNPVQLRGNKCASPAFYFEAEVRHFSLPCLAVCGAELAYCIPMGDLVAQLGIRLFFTPGPIDSMDLTIRHTNWRMSFLEAVVFGS